MRKSRLTVCTSSAVVTDQKPASAGNWEMRFDEVHRALAAHSLEQLVRGTVSPPLGVAYEHTVEIAANRCHRDLPRSLHRTRADDTG